jgi:hypothetical protein
MAIYTKPLSTNTRTWSDLDLDFTAHPVTIRFQPINTPDPVTIELFLERLR